jgi:hypothetical protein
MPHFDQIASDGRHVNTFSHEGWHSELTNVLAFLHHLGEKYTNGIGSWRGP